MYMYLPVYFIVQRSLDYVFVWVCACMGGFIVYLEFGLFVWTATMTCRKYFHGKFDADEFTTSIHGFVEAYNE